jgi:hypothetical protein
MAGAAPPNKINYEGRLTNASGTSLTGSYNMRFSITSDLAGANVVWGPETHTGVSVANGVFSVLIGETTPVTTAEISGATRYLKLEVANPGDSTTNYETLTPLSQLVSVPYALTATQADYALTAAQANNLGSSYVSQIVAGSNITVTPTSGAGAVTISATSTLTQETAVDNLTVGNNSSGSLEVKDGAIGSSKLAADLSITGTMDAASFTANMFYGNGSELTGITASSLDDGVVTETKIAAGAVTAAKISSEAVTNAKLAGSITDDKLSQIATAGKVSTAALSGTVAIANLPVGIGAGQLITMDVDAKLPTVDGSKLTNIAATSIGDNAVTASKIANGAVTAAKLAGDIPDMLLREISSESMVRGSALIGLNSVPVVAGKVPLANLPHGFDPGNLITLDATGKLPAVDGSQLTNISGQANTASNVGTYGQ